MVARKKLQIAPFDDIKVIGINTTLLDYKMAWNINRALCLDLTRYADIPIKGVDFSFYYHSAGEQCNVYDLVALTRQEKSWMNLSPHVDYILIIRNEIAEDRLQNFVKGIRGIKGVIHAFLVDLTKDFDPFLEMIELHEISIQESLSVRRNLDELRRDIMEKRKSGQSVRPATL